MRISSVCCTDIPRKNEKTQDVSDRLANYISHLQYHSRRNHSYNACRAKPASHSVFCRNGSYQRDLISDSSRLQYLAYAELTRRKTPRIFHDKRTRLYHTQLCCIICYCKICRHNGRGWNLVLRYLTDILRISCTQSNCNHPCNDRDLFIHQNQEYPKGYNSKRTFPNG